jgi:ABC-type dipeptide/oligopeptide/nickel transport system permease component|tara:strand:+ start:196 stop:576 length:381 start_codon:yes stop_codon:yes gene_type:complete
VIVSLGSGMLVDYYNLIKEEFDNIMSKDYVQFAKDSGFNKYRFASKELIFNLISISISRIPLVFSGLVIIEYNMRDDGLEGISTFIFNRLDVGDDMSMFVAVFISIIFFSLIYFLSEKIKESLIQK